MDEDGGGKVYDRIIKQQFIVRANPNLCTSTSETNAMHIVSTSVIENLESLTVFTQ